MLPLPALVALSPYARLVVIGATGGLRARRRHANDFSLPRDERCVQVVGTRRGYETLFTVVEQSGGPQVAGRQTRVALCPPSKDASLASGTMSADDKRPDEKEHSSPDALTHGSEDFRQLFQKGIRFTEELLDENERLRFKVAALEATSQTAAATAPNEALTTVAALQRRVAELETERARLVATFHAVELANLDYKSRYAEIEEEHANLANLYIASYQLHATLAFREIVQVVAEIAINLVGVERFTLFLRDATSRVLVPVFAEGGGLDERAPIVMGEGVLGTAVEEHAPRVRAPGEPESVPMAIIPLRASDLTVGAIVIDALLVQKSHFSRMDLELFHLLGVHAAFALMAGLLFDGAGPDSAMQALDVDRVRTLLSQDEGADV